MAFVSRGCLPDRAISGILINALVNEARTAPFAATWN
jgi:hypothetical protein